MSQIPQGCLDELRRSMCDETYRVVAEILGRWTETVTATSRVDNLALMSCNDPVAYTDEVRDAALRTLGMNIAQDREHDVVETRSRTMLNYDAVEHTYFVSVWRRSPRRPRPRRSLTDLINETLGNSTRRIESTVSQQNALLSRLNR